MSVNETNPEIQARLRELLEKSREYNRELVRLAREIADLRAEAGGAAGLIRISSYLMRRSAFERARS